MKIISLSFILILISLLLGLSSCSQFNLSNAHADDKVKWEDTIKQGLDAQNGGNYSEAEAKFQEAICVCEKKFGVDDPRTATAIGYLAQLYSQSQEWSKAYAQYKRWIKIVQKHDLSGREEKEIRRSMQKVIDKIKQYNLDTSK